MESEARTCQSCNNSFSIEPDDFQFYDRMKVPPPTWCSECRMQRRLIWRNERMLHKRRCNAPGHTEDIISMYHPEVPVQVYDHEYWYSDAWDAATYGREYDFSRSFFSQFKDLLYQVPHLTLFDSKSVNSSYCNITAEHKNCYLVSAGWNNEDSLYGNRISYCKNTMDSYIAHKTEFGYENVYCKDSYKLFYSKNSENCNDSYFLYDCKNCSSCVGCTNLRNKQYCIFNEQYTREDYAKEFEELALHTRDGVMAARKKFDELYNATIHHHAHLVNTTNVVGDNVENSRNCYYCFDLAGEAENVKYAHWGTYGLKDSYDAGPGTGGKSELTYEGISIGVNNANCTFGVTVWYSNSVHYSFGCQSSEYLFGCVGLRNKKYCILNKQYTKEEYEELVPKVIAHMNDMPYKDAVGRQYRHGEFFPPEISPFAYNETVAQDYLPLSASAAKSKGFLWRDGNKREYIPTIQANELPQSIKDAGDAILDSIIGCSHGGTCAHQCTGAFRVVRQEIDLYRQLNIPLPQVCPSCRHYERLAKRNPLKLWHRKCACDYKVHLNTVSHSHHGDGQCPNEFETTYAPDRPEVVYCEQCYQAEVV